MTRLILLAAILTSLSGCRLFNCNKSHCQGPSTSGGAIPVSYNGPVAPSYPASFSTPVATQPPMTTYPSIPAPAMAQTTELPMPEVVPSTINPTRSVGLPR